MRRFEYIIFILLPFLWSSCSNYPQDAEGTLNNIRGSEILAGIVQNEPFVYYSANDTTGIEVDLIRKFAQDINAKIIWVPGSEGVLMEKLADQEVHLVAGGLKETTPYKDRAGFTRPYYRDYVIAIPQGENALLIALEKFLKREETNIKKAFIKHDR